MHMPLPAGPRIHLPIAIGRSGARRGQHRLCVDALLGQAGASDASAEMAIDIDHNEDHTVFAEEHE
ncbi:MAG TPA: hypothetical protein DCP37_13130 [Dehalococcoidia bacterium]|jgi:hypothetical protein|nr:hypothetical protein [Dehalococcoidia bacterium]